MARLVAVCRDGEEEFPFEKRQIPLYIDDTLTVSPLLGPFLSFPPACCNSQAGAFPSFQRGLLLTLPQPLIFETLQREAST